MKLIYSGNTSKGSVEYSTDEGDTFVPVTLAELKNGVELSTNDLSKIQVRAGNKTFTEISVLKKFKVVETEDKDVLATLEEKPVSSDIGLIFNLNKAPNNFDKSGMFFIFVGDSCIEFSFDGDYESIKVYDYSNNSSDYKEFDEIASLLSNYSEHKLYTGEYTDGNSGSRTFSKFIDTGYVLKISDYIPYAPSDEAPSDEAN